MHRARGLLSSRTSSGDVEVAIVSSDLVLRGRLDGEVSVETVAGNLRVDNKGEGLRRLSAATVSAPRVKVQREEFGLGSSFTTRYGAGKSEIRLQTFSGDAELRLQ